MLILTSLALALPPVDDPVRADTVSAGDAAVVIGIEDYAFLPDVPFAERDAYAIADTLRLTRGIDRDKLTVLTQTPSREQMLRAVEDAAARAEPGATVWVYFAGHGAADPTSGERMLLGVDAQANQDTLGTRSIAVNELARAAGTGGREVFLIIDACFTGRGRTGSDLVPGARMVVPTAWAEPAGFTEWTATQPSQWASPLDTAEHGAFTYAVLGAMRGWADGYLDGEPDGVVTTAEADAYVERTLRDLQVRDQRPALRGPDRTLVQGQRLEAAPDLATMMRPPAPRREPPPPPPNRGPKRRDMRVVGAGAGLAGIGLITVAASYASGIGNPDIDAAKLQQLKTVNGVGWALLAAGGTTSAVALAVPTRQGVVLGVSGRF